MDPATAKWLLEALAPLTINVTSPDASYHATMAARAVAALTVIADQDQEVGE